MIPQPTPGSAADTIFALASGAGRSAIAVIRLSGPLAGAILTSLAGGPTDPRRATLRNLRDPAGALLDRALVLWLPGPGSYTGEDCAELHLHGGRAVVQAVSTALLAAGTRPADPGEFTRRAFLAGRMDLLEAEAIGDLTSAETETQRIQALDQMTGAAATQVADWTGRLTQCLAFCEALIDFPDENLPAHVEDEIGTEIDMVLSELDDHLSRAPRGEAVRNGLVFAISGPPNVGKSSLFNALAGRDMAMVSASAGTTRDRLEVRLDVDGVAVTLVDTAGLRATDDVLEAEGIRRAQQIADQADLVLLLAEPGQQMQRAGAGQQAVVITTKIDLGQATEGTLGISVHSGEGMEALWRLLATEARRLISGEDLPLLSHARHVAALRDARAHLREASRRDLVELRAEEMRAALAAIGRLSGGITTDDVLDVVFGAFCIGK